MFPITDIATGNSKVRKKQLLMRGMIYEAVYFIWNEIRRRKVSISEFTYKG